MHMQNCTNFWKRLHVHRSKYNTSTTPHPHHPQIFFLKIPHKFCYLVSLPEGAPELGQDEREEAWPQGGGDLDQCFPGGVPDLHRSRL